jgi:DNA-binding MarR family transcriptional regulator
MGDSIDQFFAEWAVQDIALPPFTDDVQYIYRIAGASRLLGARLDATCAAFGITRSQFEAMAVLRRRHPAPLTAQEIMQASMLSSGSVTAMVNQLIRAGLVRRKVDKQDGRRIQVSLTDKGRTLIDSALSPRIADNVDLSRLLSAKDRQQMNMLMCTFLAALESLPDEAQS